METGVPCCGIEEVSRRESPYVLTALLRRHGDDGDCEDAAQEAAEAAVGQWPLHVAPTDPRGRLIRVASRRLIDLARSGQARRVREDIAAASKLGPAVPAADEQPVTMMTRCCCCCCAAIPA